MRQLGDRVLHRKCGHVQVVYNVGKLDLRGEQRGSSSRGVRTEDRHCGETEFTTLYLYWIAGHLVVLDEFD
jgi:hypothetical protein